VVPFRNWTGRATAGEGDAGYGMARSVSTVNLFSFGREFARARPKYGECVSLDPVEKAATESRDGAGFARFWRPAGGSLKDFDRAFPKVLTAYRLSGVVYSCR